MGRRRGGRTINGWLCLDKPAGLTSARAVARVLAATDAIKAGHGGTLDPMATGVLPIALGEATKTTAYAMAGAKTYRFTVAWGESRDTDDDEGVVTGTSDRRPTEAEIGAALGSFIGEIDQTPPAYAAIKVDGQRAYKLARQGNPATMTPRRVRIDRLDLLSLADADHAVFEMDCGKGVYVRSLARDLAQRLGTLGHVSSLRRTAVGAFLEAHAISLEKLKDLGHSAALFEHVRPVETALDDIPALAVTDQQAAQLKFGQAVHVFCNEPGMVRATADGRLVALAEVNDGMARPVRVFNL